MGEKNVSRIAGGRLPRWPALCILAALCMAAAAPKSEEPAGEMQDLSGILGPGSQLQAAPDGEFTINIGEDGQLANFRAVKGVILQTEDINLRCDDLIYRSAEGKILATTKPGKLVHITMRGANPSGEKTPESDMRATCRRYEFFTKEQRHELTIDPTIYQRGKDGKEMAVSGKTITITQDKAGRWQMHVKGSPQFWDPKGKKPTMNVDIQPPQTQPAPPAATKAGPAPKPVKIDEGNVEKLRRPKPTRVVKIEEGG
ncbi:hypothetical protein AMJ85_11155 [candidate division BRC1 bacterium SM23_51]|nr:MAG: hypothetical protein AMJ85_11155 [candidate division BRC1 bacterium SM23_51]